MSLVDVAMVGRLGPEALAATGMGGMLMWGALSLVLGIRTSVQTISSRRLGQNKTRDCIKALNNGFLLAALYSIPVSFLGWSCGFLIIPLFIIDDITTPLAISYFSISSLGLFFNSISFVFQGFYTGIEKTKVHLRVTITSNIINAYLNVGLIYGKNNISSFFNDSFGSALDPSFFWFWAGFEGLGVTGAAIGTLIASVWMMTHYGFYLKKQTMVEDSGGIISTGLDKTMLRKQVDLSLPMGIQETMIAVGWSVFYKIMAIIGIVELATTQLLFTIMHASFMPALGVGQACATLVGKYLGEKNPDKAEQSVYESLRGSFFIMGSVGICFMLFAQYIINPFTNDPRVIEIAVPGLRFVGLLQFVDAICFTLWFALTGAGDTKIPAIVDVLTHWILFIPACYLLGITLGFGFWGPWIAFGLHLTFFAAFVFWRFRMGYWKTIKV